MLTVTAAGRLDEEDHRSGDAPTEGDPAPTAVEGDHTLELRLTEVANGAIAWLRIRIGRRIRTASRLYADDDILAVIEATAAATGTERTGIEGMEEEVAVRHTAPAPIDMEVAIVVAIADEGVTRSGPAGTGVLYGTTIGQLVVDDRGPV